MPDPYLGEIRMFAGSSAPPLWAICDGTALSIADHHELFTLIGTTYGGNGVTTFALPDMRGRLPIHAGGGRGLSYRVHGERGGSERVGLTLSQLPAHGHVPMARSEPGTTASPAAAVWAASTTGSVYSSGAPGVSMAADSIDQVGAGQPHPNVMPYLCVNFIISLFGSIPSQGKPSQVRTHP